ncbi:MAG: hypothetical protein V4760_13400 [Bdellovibrionota bacterium]
MRIPKNFLIALLVFCQLSTAAALERPLVAGPDIQDSELRVFAERQDRKTLSEALDAARPGAELEERLRARLEHAQRAWLGGSMELAKSEFMEIAALSTAGDWRDSQRDVILYAHMRLAQIVDSPTEKSAWLSKAAKLIPDLDPDPSLFPPPLLREFKDARAKVASQSTLISLRDVFPGFRFVLVDGRKVVLDSASTVRISPGLHRITALSDRHAPLTEQMTAAQLGVFRVKVNPLVESCGAPVGALHDGVEVDVYDGPKCSPPTALAPKKLDRNWADVPSEVKTRARRDWLWIGALAIGTAVAVSVYRNQRASDPSTVHREGF